METFLPPSTDEKTCKYDKECSYIYIYIYICIYWFIDSSTASGHRALFLIQETAEEPLYIYIYIYIYNDSSAVFSKCSMPACR